MDFIITLLILIVILGIIIFGHEFGHFIVAKKCGVYVDEFALGMGPVLWKYKPKNSETTYTLRAFPVGGFVSMAEESSPELKLKKSQILENKNTFQKLAVLLMGIVMNFVLAIVLFFISGLFFGKPVSSTEIGAIVDKSPAYTEGLEVGDKILEINGVKTYNWDDIILEISAKKLQAIYEFKVLKADGKTQVYNIVPKVEQTKDGEKRSFGVGSSPVKYEKGFVKAVEYGFEGFASNINTIFKIIGSLFTGKVSIDNLSGPIGIFSIIDNLKSQGLQALIYITAYLSINVGVINLIPIPVFDGGRVLLVIIETFTRKRTNIKVENILNYSGFGLMILLMIYVAFNDIIRLIG